MPFANMVKAFQSNRSNHALGISVLPGRTWRNDRFPDVQRLGLTRKSFSVDLVSITDQMAWGLLQRARLDQLPPRPIRGRMFRDIKMHQPPPVVAQHHEHEQDPKGRRGHREEIQRDQILGMILQKRAPRLRRRLSLAKTQSAAQMFDLSALIRRRSRLDDHPPAPPASPPPVPLRRPPRPRPREPRLAPATRRLQANGDPAETTHD